MVQRCTKKKLLRADHVSDFRPGIDRVERHKDGRCFVVDGHGHYAPQQVQSDVMTPEIAANLRGLGDRQRGVMHQFVMQTPFLSEEGRIERLQVLREGMKFQFVVVASYPAQG